jgi:peptide/nickel transport system ATP-binding protein
MTGPPDRYTVLEVDDLRVSLPTRAGLVRAVDGVSFSLRRGETLGIVGESGCGKSMTAMALMQLSPASGDAISGSVRFKHQELLSLPDQEMRRLRGNDIAMIFQEPMTSLNPVLTVGQQIAEAVRLHQNVSRADAWRRAVEMLGFLQIPDPERRAREYPHQLSGGMRQRAMIAIALSCEPEVLIADEPTTALDVTIQAQIMALLTELRQKFGTSLILITHDLGLVAETCDRVMVMYAGRVVESASVIDLFAAPRHPYTRGLLEAMPRLGASNAHSRLSEIPGSVPSLLLRRAGCAFAPRCLQADSNCATGAPHLCELAAEHTVACWKAA